MGEVRGIVKEGMGWPGCRSGVGMLGGAIGGVGGMRWAYSEGGQDCAMRGLARRVLRFAQGGLGGCACQRAA